MTEKNVTIRSSSGIRLGSLLTIVFIVLKLLGKISWSWVWVLAPLWIGVVIWIALVIVALIIGYIANR